MDVFDALNILGIEYNAKPKEAGQAYIRLMTENLEDDSQRTEIREAYERVVDELPYKLPKHLYSSFSDRVVDILFDIFAVLSFGMLIELFWPWIFAFLNGNYIK